MQSSLQDAIIPALFPHSIAVRLGAQVFPDLRGNFVYPSLSTPSARAAASGENTAVAVDSTARFSQLVLTPQRLTTECWISRRLVTQSHDRQGEKFLSNQILAGLGALLDGLALTGNAAGYAPITGLLNNSGLSTITYGGSVTWAQVQQQIYNVSNLNFPIDDRAWAISPATRQKLATSQNIAASNFPCYIYDSDTNTIAGYPVAETTNLTGNQIIYGRWPELSICLWGAADVLSDPYTYLSQNVVASRFRLSKRWRVAPCVLRVYRRRKPITETNNMIHQQTRRTPPTAEEQTARLAFFEQSMRDADRLNAEFQLANQQQDGAAFQAGLVEATGLSESTLIAIRDWLHHNQIRQEVTQST